MLSGVCRRCLSSSVILHGGPVSLHPIRATSCYKFALSLLTIEFWKSFSIWWYYRQVYSDTFCHTWCDHWPCILCCLVCFSERQNHQCLLVLHVCDWFNARSAHLFRMSEGRSWNGNVCRVIVWPVLSPQLCLAHWNYPASQRPTSLSVTYLCHVLCRRRWWWHRMPASTSC